MKLTITTQVMHSYFYTNIYSLVFCLKNIGIISIEIYLYFVFPNFPKIILFFLYDMHYILFNTHLDYLKQKFMQE